MFHNDSCFQGENQNQIYNAIKQKNTQWSNNCPPEAKDLILKLLAYKPEDRLSLEDALKHPYMINYTSSVQSHSVDLYGNSKSANKESFTPLAARYNPIITGSGRYIDDDQRVGELTQKRSWTDVWCCGLFN